MLVSAIAFLALAFLVVLGPLIFQAAVAYAPWMEPLKAHYDVARFGIGGLVIAGSLVILHLWLPAGRRQLRQRVARHRGDAWCCGSPADLPSGAISPTSPKPTSTYYAGLASAMIALVFLYYSAWIFIFGGELNAAIARERDGET